jgi:hypothetical protein
MFNANPGLEGRIKRAPHGHYVSAFGKKAEMFMWGDNKYICLRKGKRSMVFHTARCECHILMFKSAYGGIKSVSKVDYIYFANAHHPDLTTWRLVEQRPFYTGFSGAIEDTIDYYNEFRLTSDHEHVLLACYDEMEDDRFGLDLSEYFTDIGEFLILLLELY